MRVRIEREGDREGQGFDHLLARFTLHAARGGLSLIDHLPHLTVKATIAAGHMHIHIDPRLVPLRFAHALGAGSHRIVKGVLIRAARRRIVVDANGDGIGSKRGERMENRWQREEHERRLTRRCSVAQAR